MLSSALLSTARPAVPPAGPRDSLAHQPAPADPLRPQRRSYSCATLDIATAPLATTACMRGQGCPFVEETEGECAHQCDVVAGCRVFIHVRSAGTKASRRVSGMCYLYDRDHELTRLVSTAGEASRLAEWRVRRCAVDNGVEVACHPTPSTNASLTLVLVMKFETRNLRSWLLYHVQMGVTHFVIISNECSDEAHAALTHAAAGVPCSPRLSFINAFRCEVGFQIRAYTEAVRVLINAGERDDVRVGFWDVDEYLVASPHYSSARGTRTRGNLPAAVLGPMCPPYTAVRLHVPRGPHSVQARLPLWRYRWHGSR